MYTGLVLFLYIMLVESRDWLDSSTTGRQKHNCSTGAPMWLKSSFHSQETFDPLCLTPFSKRTVSESNFDPEQQSDTIT